MRIAPLGPDRWDDEVVRALSVMMPSERARPEKVGNMLATFARHPRLLEAYLTFNMHLLLTTTLPKRIVETVVLRTAVSRGSKYLWDHHLPLAERAGLTADDCEAVRSGDPTDRLDAAVVTAVDELNENTVITEATWDELGAHLSEQQLMDLVFTVGGYVLLTMAIQTFGVENEGEAE